MASVITIAGEQLFAAKAQANEQLDIDTFIFANVPNQDPNAPINREEGIPTANIVYQQNVQQVGRINDNVVVYSTVLDSITGPFEFNWVGLYSSVNQKLVAINHVPTVTKTATAPGAAGNTLNRNFGIEYSGIADLTGITVEPETWQLDFTARLSGMDLLTQQLAADMNGKDWFIDDGLKVVPRTTANTFSVTPGVGYVSGLRVELKQEHILIVQSYPQFVYVDAWFSGNANSTWSPQLAFTVTNTEMDDYIDPSGTQHYVYKLAVINAADAVEDHRENSMLKEKSALSLSYLKNKKLKEGVILETSSYYSNEECVFFGIKYPDGGGARYLTVKKGDFIADSVTVVSGLFVDFKLLSMPNVKNSGMVGNYKSDADKGFDNYFKLRKLNEALEKLGGVFTFNGDKYYFSEPIEISVDTKGNSKTELYIDPKNELAPLFSLGVGCILKRVKILPSHTNSIKSFIENEFSETYGISFNYHDKAGGLNPLGDNIIVDVKALSQCRAARGGGNDITYVRGVYQGGIWGASIYAIKRITFDGTLIIGGSSGGMAMPSCKNITITGGATVYNPDGTGINSGGSNATGFNVENVNIAGVNVYARDCINLENGCENANIIGYTINVITSNEINGVAIGVYSRTADNGGKVNNISIGQGSIRGQNNSRYSHAVKVGVSGTGEKVSGISICNVDAKDCRIGVSVESPSNSWVESLSLCNNNIKASLKGYVLPSNLKDSMISGGNLILDKQNTISGYQGVTFGLMNKVKIVGLHTKGWYPHYKQQGTVTNSEIINPFVSKGDDNANTITLENISGTADILIKQFA